MKHERHLNEWRELIARVDCLHERNLTELEKYGKKLETLPYSNERRKTFSPLYQSNPR